MRETPNAAALPLPHSPLPSPVATYLPPEGFIVDMTAGLRQIRPLLPQRAQRQGESDVSGLTARNSLDFMTPISWRMVGWGLGDEGRRIEGRKGVESQMERRERNEEGSRLFPLLEGNAPETFSSF